MRAYKIKVGDYYRLRIPKPNRDRPTDTEGKILEEVDKPTPTSHNRFRCEVTSGQYRGKVFVLTSDRIRPLEEEDGEGPEQDAEPEQEERDEEQGDLGLSGLVKSVPSLTSGKPDPRRNRGQVMKVHLSMEIPVTKLSVIPELVELLDEYNPRVDQVVNQPTERG